MRLEEVQQATPVRWPLDRLWLAGQLADGRRPTRAHRWLVGPGAVGGIRPDGLQGRVAGACRDGPCKGQRRGVGVVLGRGRLAANAAPGVERDPGLLQFRRELVAAGLDLQRPRHVESIVGSERFARPAIGQERPVEPGVRRLVQDHKVVRVVRDLDEARARVEQPRVATSGAADRLLDDEPASASPGQADPLGEERQGAVDEAADAVGPGLVFGPRPDGQRDRCVPHRRRHRPLGVRARSVADEIREERERLAELAGLVNDVAGGVRGRRRDGTGLHLRLETRREHDPDGTAQCRVRGERPDRERRE